MPKVVVTTVEEGLSIPQLTFPAKIDPAWCPIEDGDGNEMFGAKFHRIAVNIEEFRSFLTEALEVSPSTEAQLTW